MRTYIYIKQNHATRRGCNKTIIVYRIKRNIPEFVGYGEFNSAGWAGAKVEANRILRQEKCETINDVYRVGNNKYQLLLV